MLFSFGVTIVAETAKKWLALRLTAEQGFAVLRASTVRCPCLALGG